MAGSGRRHHPVRTPSAWTSTAPKAPLTRVSGAPEGGLCCPVHPKPPSSSGLGHHPLKVATRVRIPLGVPATAAQVSGLATELGASLSGRRSTGPGQMWARSPARCAFESLAAMLAAAARRRAGRPARRSCVLCPMWAIRSRMLAPGDRRSFPTWRRSCTCSPTSGSTRRRPGQRLVPIPVEVAALGVAPRGPTNSRPLVPASDHSARCPLRSGTIARGIATTRTPAFDFGRPVSNWPARPRPASP